MKEYEVQMAYGMDVTVKVPKAGKTKEERIARAVEKASKIKAVSTGRFSVEICPDVSDASFDGDFVTLEYVYEVKAKVKAPNKEEAVKAAQEKASWSGIDMSKAKCDSVRFGIYLATMSVRENGCLLQINLPPGESDPDNVAYHILNCLNEKEAYAVYKQLGPMELVPDIAAGLKSKGMVADEGTILQAAGLLADGAMDPNKTLVENCLEAVRHIKERMGN